MIPEVLPPCFQIFNIRNLLFAVITWQSATGDHCCSCTFRSNSQCFLAVNRSLQTNGHQRFPQWGVYRKGRHTYSTSTGNLCLSPYRQMDACSVFVQGFAASVWSLYGLEHEKSAYSCIERFAFYRLLCLQCCSFQYSLHSSLLNSSRSTSSTLHRFCR